MNILSVQSHVAYGHVGNAAAIPCLHALGHEVWAVHTVHFSNHPGHGGFTGRAATAEEVGTLLDGIAARGVLGDCGAIVSGYLGDANNGPPVLAMVEKVKIANPGALYLCDPVIGDAGRVFVRAGIPEFFRDRALARADIVTPNAFELGWLTEMPVNSLAEAAAAATALRGRLRPGGPRLVLATGIRVGSDSVTLLHGAETTLTVTTPWLDGHLHGTGDSLAALFLGRILSGQSHADALSAAVSGLHAVIAAAVRERLMELPLVAERARLVAPDPLVPAAALPAAPAAEGSA
jgi:pyridoxine kinase